VHSLRREYIQDGQAAQAEARVIQIGTTLAAREAAIGILGCAEVAGVAGAHLARQQLHTGVKAGHQADQIRLGDHLVFIRIALPRERTSALGGRPPQPCEKAADPSVPTTGVRGFPWLTGYFFFSPAAS